MLGACTFRVEEVTGAEAVPLHHQTIDELESAGFTRLGLLTMKPADEDAQLARYTGSHREQAERRLRRPRQVMVPADESAFGVVDVGATGALVTFSTLLDSGALVETYLLPGTTVPLPMAAQARRRSFYTRSSAPHRLVTTVDATNAADAAEAHRASVARHREREGGTVTRHHQMSQVTLLLEHALAHDTVVQRSLRRVRRIVRGLLLVVAVLVGTTAAWGLVRLGSFGGLGGAVLVAALLSIALSWVLGKLEPQITSRVERSPRVRPAFSPPPLQP